MLCVIHYGNMCVVGGILTYGALSFQGFPSSSGVGTGRERWDRSIPLGTV